MEGEPSSNILGGILQQYLSNAVSEAPSFLAIISVVAVITIAAAIIISSSTPPPIAAATVAAG